MKTAITVCLAPEAAQGPFVFHEGLEHGCRRAAELGFDAVEIFPRDPDSFPADEVREQVARHNLQVAALGTGAGMVVHGLHLADPDASRRSSAQEFIGKIIDLAGSFQAPAIIGSMQGRFGGDVSRDQALDWLASALQTLGERAATHGKTLLYEPLNRYESNLIARQADAARFLKDRDVKNVRLLCDLFHMNIEEADVAQALVDAGEYVGHIHWADSNRSAMGMGHTPSAEVAEALGNIGFAGYLSAEIFPVPDADAAATATIENLRRCFPAS